MITSQIAINIIFSATLYLLLAYSFTLIYYTAKFFNLTHAAIITFGAYFTFLLTKQFMLPLLFSIIAAIFLAVAIGLVAEWVVIKPLRKRNSHPFKLLIASLGIYVILQNIISLVWGDATKSIRRGEISVGNDIFGAYVTNTQILIIIISIVLCSCVNLFLTKNIYGRHMRAVSSNESLAGIFGISSNRIVLLATILGSALAAIAGILIAFDTDMTPTMGFNLLLYGIAAMIIGGIGSFRGLIGGALLVATAQHLAGYYIDTKWIDAITYLILILFLIWRPLGFSGKRLKKIEV